MSAHEVMTLCISFNGIRSTHTPPSIEVSQLTLPMHIIGIFSPHPGESSFRIEIEWESLMSTAQVECGWMGGRRGKLFT